MTKKLILVIDHEDSVREVLRACLRYLGGWNVLSVASFQEGLDTLRTEQPDAIVLDEPTHSMDDLTLVQYLRINPLTRSIPILLLSAKAKWFSQQQLQELGIAGAIAKPFNSGTLSNQIAGILGWSVGNQGDEQQTI